MQACIACRGLYDSIVSPVVGSLTDMSMQLYIIALRESLRIGPLREICWIEISDMLVDAQTKWMDDVLWKSFYGTSYWRPSKAIGTRRIGKGTLEKSTKEVIDYTRSYSSRMTPEDFTEREIPTILGFTHSEDIWYQDVFC